MLTLVAWVGSVLLALCAIFGAYDAYQKNYCYVSWLFLACWFLGEVCLAIYAINTEQYHLLFNYVVNIAGVIIMAFYNKNGVDL